MNKTANCIEMLQLLSSGKSYKTKELAEFLDTNPRNISEYKKELEECGYRFESMSGKYGGIKLLSSSLIPSISFTVNEKRALSFAYYYLLNDKTLLFKDDYLMAMNKIFAGVNWESIKRHEVLVISEFKVNKSSKEIEKIYTFFEESIETKEVVKITYLSNAKNKIEDKIEPYKLFAKDLIWCLLAYSRNNERYVVVKLSCIKAYEKTGSFFSRDYFYNDHLFDDEFDSSLDGKPYHIKLKLDKSNSFAKDNIYGKNQKIEEFEDGLFTLEFDMRNSNKIVSFILSFREGCEVLSPISIRDKVRLIANRIYLKNCYIGDDNDGTISQKKSIGLVSQKDELNKMLNIAINCSKLWKSIDENGIKKVINGTRKDAMNVINELIKKNYIYKKEKEDNCYFVNGDAIKNVEGNVLTELACGKMDINSLYPTYAKKIENALKGLKENDNVIFELDINDLYELKDILAYFKVKNVCAEIEINEKGDLLSAIFKLSKDNDLKKHNLSELMPNELYKLFKEEKYLTIEKISKRLKIDKKEVLPLLDKLVDANAISASIDAKDSIHFNFKKEIEIKNSSLTNLEKDILRYAKETDFIFASEIQYKFKLGFPKVLSYLNRLICDGWLVKEKGDCYCLKN